MSKENTKTEDSATRDDDLYADLLKSLAESQGILTDAFQELSREVDAQSERDPFDVDGPALVAAAQVVNVAIANASQAGRMVEMYTRLTTLDREADAGTGETTP